MCCLGQSCHSKLGVGIVRLFAQNTYIIVVIKVMRIDGIMRIRIDTRIVGNERIRRNQCSRFVVAVVIV